MPDPRDELGSGITALAAIRDLVADISASGGRFDCAGPQGLAELLSMVEGRLRPAVDEVQSYVPRNWRPPAA